MEEGGECRRAEASPKEDRVAEVVLLNLDEADERDHHPVAGGARVEERMAALRGRYRQQLLVLPVNLFEGVPSDTILEAEHVEEGHYQFP